MRMVLLNIIKEYCISEAQPQDVTSAVAYVNMMLASIINVMKHYSEIPCWYRNAMEVIIAYV